MARITRNTANWRLFGGGGLIVGGFVLALVVALPRLGLGVPSWLVGLSLLFVAVALVLVALGETGSNGAVGRSVLGRVALLGYAAGFLLLALTTIAPLLGAPVATLGALLVIIGGLISAYAVYQRHVARGAARWVLFAPAVVGTVWALSWLGVAVLAGLWWLGLLLALLLLVTGVLYLLNDRRIG